MKEHPIIFSGPMVRAILEGRKTQTRRVIRNPEKYFHIRECGFCCPYGWDGDLLWVREAWMSGPNAAPDKVIYRADIDDVKPWDNLWKWHPSIHMPRWASRLTLEITDVRVERVQKISPMDCEAEVITGKTLASPVRGQPYEEYENKDGIIYTTPILAFAALWDSINLNRGFGWDMNPFCWVITFKRKD